MKVWISAHGRFHSFDLARELNDRGLLAGVATTYPRHVVRRFLDPAITLRTAPWIEAYRRLGQTIPLLGDHDRYVPGAFGRFAAKVLPPAADIFVGWSNASLEAIGPAKDRGMQVVIERGSSHILHQTAALSAAAAETGLQCPLPSQTSIQRECEEYARADAVAVPSTFAASTFVAQGIPPERLIVNRYGADLDRFTPPPAARRTGGKVTVLFVGSVSLRKGVPWLLRAIASMPNSIALHLVGPIDEGVARSIRRLPEGRVRVEGPLRGQRLVEAYRSADIFCLPSVEEGMPLAALQAMAAGLPLVITQEAGATDIVTPGVEGFIVPSRDAEAISDAVTRLALNGERRIAMGAAARHRVVLNHRWTDYGARAVDAYRALLRHTLEPFSREAP